MAVIISTNYTQSSPGADTPLNHARIGYQDIAGAATLTASTEVAGFEADSVQNPLTYEHWKPSAMPATLTFNFGSAKAFNYIGIAAHSLGTDGASLVAEYSTDGIAWSTLDVDDTPADDRAVMLLFDQVTVQYMRLTFSGATAPEVGVVYCGTTLDMYRPFFGGHVPGVLSRRTTIKPNKSEGGQWLGRSILRTGLATEYQWRHIPLSWYETNVEPFSLAARAAPFFVAWNPLEYPGHVLYAWTSDDMAPELMGVRDLVQFGVTVEGYE